MQKLKQKIAAVKVFLTANKKLIRTHIAYQLIIINMIAWSIAVYSGHNFYKEYVSLEIKNVSAEAGNINEPVVYDKEWALDQWEKLGGQELRDEAVLVFFGESGFNKDATHCNTNGTVDLGFYQANSVHIPKRLSIECAGSIKCSTEKMLELYKEQGWTPWTQAKKLGIK